MSKYVILILDNHFFITKLVIFSYNMDFMPSSIFHSPNSTLQRLIQAYNIQPKKYQRKGIGKYVGYVLLVSYFTLLPKLFQSVLPFLILNLPEKFIMGLGVMLINILVLLCYNTALYFIYRAKHPFFEKYRVNMKSWPWEENYDQWKVLLKKTLNVVLFNSIVVGGTLGIVDSLVSDYRVQIKEIPDTKTILWQFLFFLLMEDLFFYIGHSTLHRPQFYWIHKRHHEFKTTVTIAAEYAHPLEHIFSNAFPTFIGYKILSHIVPVHCITIWVFVTFRVIETCDGHSGYEWSWAQSQLLPFSAGSAYHNFHHSHNVGNYGSFFKFWDSLFGTNADYVKFKAGKKQIQNQKMNETVNPEAKGHIAKKQV